MHLRSDSLVVSDLRVASAIGEYLHEQGVETIFTLLSEDVMDITSRIQEVFDDEIEVIEARHEQLATAMADGYAQSSGDVGVSIVGRGPAIAQTGTALVTARKQGSPVLVITAESPTTATDDLKGFSQETFLEATIGDVRTVRDPAAVVPTLADAFHALRNDKGPIAVQIAWDVIEDDVDLADDWTEEHPRSATDSVEKPRILPDDTSIDEMVDLYLDSGASDPPTILVGRGAVWSDAKEAIEDLAERIGAVIVTTLRAQGYFPEHPFAAGFVGNIGDPLANRLVVESDFVLAVGASLTDYTTDDGHVFADDATIVHVDVEPSNIGKHTPVDLGVVGDARIAVERFDSALGEIDIGFSETFWTENLQRRIAEAPLFPDRDFPSAPDRIDPRDLLPVLDDIVPANRNLVVGAGHFAYWIFDGITVPHPDSLVWPIQFGSIGLGLPAGVGTALASSNDETTITFCGDGGMMMSLQALETAVRHEVPLVVVVMNDDALGAEYAQLSIKGGYTEAGIIEAPDFASVAEALGAESYTVRSLADLDDIDDVLDRRPDGPVVVECKVNREVRHRRWG